MPQRAAAMSNGRELVVLCNPDMLCIILPLLDGSSFASLRGVCTEVRDACSQVTETLRCVEAGACLPSCALRRRPHPARGAGMFLSRWQASPHCA